MAEGRASPRVAADGTWVSDFWGVGYVGSRVTAEHPYPPTVHSTSPTASRPIPSYPPTPTRSLETLHNIPQTKESSMKEGRGRTSHDTHIAKYSCLRAYESAPARRPFGGLATVSADNCQENLPFVQKGSRETTRSLDRPVRRRRRGGRGQGRARRGHGRGRLGRGAPYPPTLRGPPPRPLDPYPPPLLPLGRAGVSRNSFRNLLCCPFFRCAKFRAKFDMLTISLEPKFASVGREGHRMGP